MGVFGFGRSRRGKETRPRPAEEDIQRALVEQKGQAHRSRCHRADSAAAAEGIRYPAWHPQLLPH